MAKILFGPVAADVRNKIGGTVFSKNRAGAYIRRKSSPVQPQTQFQTAIRSGLAGFAKQWGGILTPAERLAWTLFAQGFPVHDKFGQSVTLTGEQMFVRLNQNIVNNGGTAITTPPVNLTVTGPTSMTISANHIANVLNIVTLVPVLGANEVAQVSATRPLSAGRAFTNSFLRSIRYADPALVFPDLLSAFYVAKYGSFALGQKITVGVVIINTLTGAASQRITATAIAT